MNIILARHAKSDYDWNKWPTDSVRPLSEKGISRQHKVSQGMLRKSLDFDEVWVSPYTRAKQTLEIIQQYQPGSASVKTNNNLIPSGNPKEIFRQLKEENNKYPTKKLLLVGHNPNMSELLELLSDNEVELPDMRTSDVAICELTNDSSSLTKFYSRNDLY